MPSLRNWSYPTDITLGQGSLKQLPEACHSIGIRKPLVVTDKGLEDHQIIHRCLGILRDAGFSAKLFSKVDPNPNQENLDAGITTYLSLGADGIVAIGGGSALDLGKLIAFMAVQKKSVWEFEDFGDLWKKAESEGICPIIALPTTAGTGSEVGRAGVLTDTRSKTKKVIFHPKMLPTKVIADPDLTYSLPPPLVAGTGMDAFAHCLEAYCSPAFHPMSQGIALEGLRLVKENLLNAFEDKENLEARENMLCAAMMGAVAFQKGLGAIHSISHPIGSLYDKHHGTTNAVVMPFVLEFNRPTIEDKIISITKYLDIPGGFEGFLEYVLDLRSALSIPENLTAFGIPNDNLRTMTEIALKDPTAGGNPVPLNYESVLELYKSCF